MMQMDSRWGVLAVVCLVILLVAGGSWMLSRGPEAPDLHPPVTEEQIAEVRGLMDAHRYEEALEKLDPLVGANPDQLDLNFLMGLCLFQVSRYERAMPHLEIAARSEATRDASRFLLGTILSRIDRPQQALPLLEVPLKGAGSANDEANRIVRLAECYMDLEQFQNALALLRDQPLRPAVLQLRYKALRYLGREKEAQAILDRVSAAAKDNPDLQAQLSFLRASKLRENGKFDEASAEFGKIRKALAGDKGFLRVVDRSELLLFLEAGRLAELEKAATALAGKSGGKVHGDALWYLAVAQLEAGRAEAAKATAATYLENVDRDYSPLRLQTLMMRQLAGEISAEEVRKEAALVSRFRANDIYFFLALSTGDRSWAERAKEATPGRNAPAHAIDRLLAR